MRERRMEEQEEETVGKTTAKKMWLKYEFFAKASDPPPSLLEFSRHFFHFFQNYLTKILKKIFFTVLSLLAHWHLFAFDCFRANKKCLKTFGSAGTPPPYGKKLIFEQTFLKPGLP